MKWPETLTLIRHDTSSYNELKQVKEVNPLYQKFKKSYSQDPASAETKELALEVKQNFALNVGDHNTPLGEGNKAEQMAETLKEQIALPDVIFVSPYYRTKLTLERMTEGWPQLKDIPTFEEERIREQEHGMALIYNDWRVFYALHPEQRELHKIEGDYWYRYPQGENVPDVRERVRSWQNTLVREFAEKNVLAVTHHLTILSTRANLERWDSEQFIHFDKEDKPINCGVTIYKGRPDLGKDGKLLLEVYNQRLY